MDKPLGSNPQQPFARRVRRRMGRIRRRVRAEPTPRATTSQGQPRRLLAKERGFPQEWVRLSVAWARESMIEGDWPEAIQRWQQLLDRFGPGSSWSAYHGLIIAYGASGQPATADAVAERARTLFPESVPLSVAWAGLPMAEEDWPAAIERWESVLKEYGPTASWKPYRGLANCHEQLGDVPAAAAIAETGRHHFPDSPEVAVTWAQIPMMEEDLSLIHI